MYPPLSATPLSHIPGPKETGLVSAEPWFSIIPSSRFISARVEQPLTSDRLSSIGSLSGCRSLVNRVPACFTVRTVESVCLIHCCSCSPFINDPWNRSSTRGRHPNIHVDVSEYEHSGASRRSVNLRSQSAAGDLRCKCKEFACSPPCISTLPIGRVEDQTTRLLLPAMIIMIQTDS